MVKVFQYCNSIIKLYFLLHQPPLTALEFTNDSHVQAAAVMHHALDVEMSRKQGK